MTNQIYHGMFFIAIGDYPFVTYCEIERDIDDSETGTKNYKNHFVTFDDNLITCETCIKNKENDEND